MVQTLIIAVAAGFAAALLFLAPESGSVLAFPLFVLTGLPLAIATFGWGLAAGAGAAAAAAIVIFAVYPASIVTPAMFLCLFGVPIVWLANFAGSVHPLGTGDAGLDRRELGTDLMQLVATVIVSVVAAALVSGYNSTTLVGEVTAAMLGVMTQLGTTPAPTAEQIQPLVGIYVRLLPFVTALMLTAIFVFDLWVGVLVARNSRRMTGNLAPLWSVEPPGILFPAFVVAVVLAFVPGIAGDVGKVAAGALFGGFVLVGLAVVHALTRGSSSRLPLLVLCYLLLFFSGVPAVLLAIAGIAEIFLRLRQRRPLDRTSSH